MEKKSRMGIRKITGVCCLLCMLIGTMFAGCKAKSDAEKGNKGQAQADGADLEALEKLWGALSGVSDNSLGDNEEFLEKADNIKTIIDLYFWQDTEDTDLYEGMYRGLMESLDDPYSCYYTKEEYAALMEEMEGVYCGIGALVSQNATTNAITIVRPFVDGPAYKAGMLPGDIITKIDGEDVSAWELDVAVKHMKGEQGTIVEVEVWRSTLGDYVDLTITRDLVEVETVTYQMLDDSIGYIYVMQFDEITTSQFNTALRNLQSQGMKGLIVDIRDNGGGLLTTVCDMLDLFLEKDLIVYTLDKYNFKEEIHGKAGTVGEFPMAVLVNGYSASASEIFSGALQDYGLATIVGTQTFGKGIVQNVIPLGDGSAVKLTVSTYYTPKGRCIHGTGVTPDVVVELDDELKQLAVIPVEQDNQLQTAIEVLKEQMQ